MKKLLITSLVFAATAATADINNWVSSGAPVRNSVNECWRNSSWTPATAHPDCDGAIKPVQRVQVTIAPAPIVTPAPITVPTPRSEAPKAAVAKATYAADVLFDFDRSTLRPEGRAQLDQLVLKLQKINLEVVIVVGHTDWIGTDAYNLKLGDRRAQAVKNYLIERGIERQRVYTESKGEKQPIADNRTADGRAKNRRVEIEVVGTQK